MDSSLLMLLGGSALLIYSMQEISQSIQYLAGAKFRVWINTFAGNNFAAVILGFLLSVLLTSSGAVTVMLVGLANARLLTLRQVLAVTLGAAVGTTFIVQIIAFRVTEYALLIVALGVLIGAFSSSNRNTQIARSIVYLGLMFFSMSLLMDAGMYMEQSGLFQYTIHYFHDRPMVSFFIAAAIAAIIHSSAATIAFVMSFMVTSQWTVFDAIPWVLGANLGTTATAYLASLSGGTLGKRAALAHLIIKIFGVALCYPFMYQLGILSMQFSDDLPRQIANSHTLFNLLIAIGFFPLISAGEKLVRLLLPQKEKATPFSFRYLDDQSLRSPELALAQTQREILRLSDLVERMVTRSIDCFERWDEQKVEAIRETDQVVDYLNKGIKLYLTKLSQKEMSKDQVQREFALLLRTNDLESVGDIVDGHILALAKKHHKKGYSFSKEGWQDIRSFHKKVVECVRLSTAYFASEDRKLGAKLMRLDREIEELMIEYTEKHLKRLHRGIKETKDTTSIHPDLLGNLQRISSLSINFATFRGFHSD